MGRGPKPAKGRAKPAVARKSPKNDAARVRDLEKRLAEALEREKATGEILRVIGISSTDIQPVFATVAETAARLCKASDASIFRLDGDRLRRVAHHGSIPAGVIGGFSLPLVRGSFAGRSVLAETIPVKRLDRVQGPRVKIPAALLQQAAVRDLVRERVREGVLEIRKGARLVEELGGRRNVQAPSMRIITAPNGRYERMGRDSTETTAPLPPAKSEWAHREF